MQNEVIDKKKARHVRKTNAKETATGGRADNNFAWGQKVANENRDNYPENVIKLLVSFVYCYVH